MANEDRGPTVPPSPRRWREMQFSGSEVLVLVMLSLIFCVAFLLVALLNRPPAQSGDLIDLLFGAASISLFLVSFFVALLGIFGWQSIREFLRERVDAAVQVETKELSGRIDQLEAQSGGRLKAGLGAVFGMVAFDGPPYEREVVKQDLLDFAIANAQLGYDELLTIPESQYRWTALNNLLYFKSAKREDRDFVLANVEALRQYAAKAPLAQRQTYLLTYCKAVLTFSSSGEKREEVRRLLEEISARPLETNAKREADHYLVSLLAQQSLDGGP